MDTSSLITQRLTEHFKPTHLEVIDESHRHAGHAGARDGGGHFIVVLVSDAFEGKGRVEQHRMVYALFEDEMKRRIHALALKTYTPAQWAGQGKR